MRREDPVPMNDDPYGTARYAGFEALKSHPNSEIACNVSGGREGSKGAVNVLDPSISVPIF